MQIYNLGQKSICRLSHVLEQLPPTTSEMELDYHEEVDKWDVSWVAKWLKAWLLGN